MSAGTFLIDFSRICCSINSTLKQLQCYWDTKLQFYNVMAVPATAYVWIFDVTVKQQKKAESSEMNYAGLPELLTRLGKE